MNVLIIIPLISRYNDKHKINPDDLPFVLFVSNSDCLFILVLKLTSMSVKFYKRYVSIESGIYVVSRSNTISLYSLLSEKLDTYFVFLLHVTFP